jgi:hypothetical protein
VAKVSKVNVFNQMSHDLHTLYIGVSIFYTRCCTYGSCFSLMFSYFRAHIAVIVYVCFNVFIIVY